MGRRRVSSFVNNALGLPVHSAPSEAAIKRKTASPNLRAGPSSAINSIEPSSSLRWVIALQLTAHRARQP
jgi:hypothetical protein